MIVELNKFDNLKVVESFDGPVLIMHGLYDELIPYTNGVALSKAAKKGSFITYHCRHNDCPPDGYQYWKDIQKFLVENGI